MILMAPLCPSHGSLAPASATTAGGYEPVGLPSRSELSLPCNRERSDLSSSSLWGTSGDLAPLASSP